MCNSYFTVCRMTTKVYLDHTITAFDPAFLKSYQMRAFGYSFYSNICPSTSIFYFFSDISSFMFWGVFKYIKCLQKNNPQFSSSLSFKSHRSVPSMKSTVTPITSNFFHIPFCSITSVFFNKGFLEWNLLFSTQKIVQSCQKFVSREERRVNVVFAKTCLDKHYFCVLYLRYIPYLSDKTIASLHGIQALNHW